MNGPVAIYDDGNERPEEIELEPRTFAELPRVSDEVRELEARWAEADKKIAALRDDERARDDFDTALNTILRGLRDYTEAAHRNPVAAGPFTERLNELGQQICSEAWFRNSQAQGAAFRIKFPGGMK